MDYLHCPEKTTTQHTFQPIFHAMTGPDNPYERFAVDDWCVKQGCSHVSLWGLGAPVAGVISIPDRQSWLTINRLFSPVLSLNLTPILRTTTFYIRSTVWCVRLPLKTAFVVPRSRFTCRKEEAPRQKWKPEKPQRSKTEPR